MAVPANVVSQQGLGVVPADLLNTFAQGCNNTPTLRNFIGLPNMLVYLLGITTPNDGGEGSFYWNPTSEAPDDNANVIVPNGVTMGAWLRLGAQNISASFPVSFDFLGGSPPTASETMGIASFPVAVTFPANFTGSTGYVLVNPTATLTVTITNKANTTVGTMVISTAGAYTFTSTGAEPITFNIGDAMIFTAQVSPDATAANFGWTMLGQA